MHQGKEFYALSKIGPYTFAPHIVAARDNSRFCACVVHPVATPWGETKQAICVKHTIIISQDKHGRLISEDEAHYICGILNSDIVKAYIHATFKTNGFSLNKSHLYLPRYDASNPLHGRISRLARYASLPETVSKRAKITRLLSVLYLRMCTLYRQATTNDPSPRQGELFPSSTP